ncbi:MAG TPA: glycosyltransferase family 2 protein [Chloroflexota bacterium]|nr:glycosyltransferase family 2 protein [Chloroflexota bacterium]
MISAIIPTLNEESIIDPAVRALLDDPTECEVLVVDGGSRDRTAQIVRAFGPPVRLVEQTSRGRGAAYNQAAALARGETLMFLHADSRLPPAGLGLIDAALRAPAVVGGGFLPRFADTEAGSAPLTLRLIERAWRARTTAFRWFAGDQAPFVRRAAFVSCGGYPEIRLAEDWAFARRLRALGQLVVIDQPVRVSARRHLSNGVLKTLLVTGSIEVMFRAGVEPAFLAWWYRRWLPRERG